MINMNKILFYKWILGAFLLLPLILNAQVQVIKIGTGGASGVYYSIGSSICRYLKSAIIDGQPAFCLNELTNGSVENAEKLGNETFDLGLMQADALSISYKGEQPDLRTVINLHEEKFTIVAGKRSRINSFDDLAGKSISVGLLGSGTYASLNEVLYALDLTESYFSNAYKISPDETIDDLCSGKIQAMVHMVGHPNNYIHKAISQCGGRFVSFSQKQMDKIIDKFPLYNKSSIKKGGYVGQPEIPTFGIKAILVTSASKPLEEVYVITQKILSNFDDLATSHPALKELKLLEAIDTVGHVPFHPGALKFFKESGLMPKPDFSH